MTPQLWKQVEALFAEASELPREARKAFLDRSCPDSDVRREVESLLGYAAGEDPHLRNIVSGVAALMPGESAGPEQPRDLIGRTLGPYRITGLIGHGGMGEIYAAEDPRLGRPIALKLLPSADTEDAARLRRFQREARAASALNHPNIVTIYDFGEAEGIQYIATELVQGRTIRQIIAQGVLPVSEVVAIALQIANALAAAHEARIVHRDIKPENVMVRPDGYVKVLDFGLAKLRQRESPSEASVIRTIPGIIMGTARYMSPEQARGLETDARSDIFSLGVMLYEMLIREPPFTGDTASDVLAAILRQEPASLEGVAPPALDAIIRKCLRKDRSERYATANELAADLRELKREMDSSERLSVRTTPAEGLPGPVLTSAPPASTPAAPEKLPSRRRAIGWAAAALGAGGLGILGYEWMGAEQSISPDNLQITPFAISNLYQAVISPDGKYVACVTNNNRNLSGLVVRQLVAGGNEITLIAPNEAGLEDVSYSPDGTYLYYRQYSKDGHALYRQFALGGTPQKLIERIDGPAAVSPDGGEMVFFRSGSRGRGTAAELILARTDGSNSRVLVSTSDEFPFVSYEWTPDGKAVRYVSGKKSPTGNQSYLAEVDLQGSPPKIVLPLATPPMVHTRLAGRRGVFTILPDPEAGHQIWYVSTPRGERRKLTHDTNDYRMVSVTADSKTILAVYRTDALNVYLVDLTMPSATPRQITTGLASYHAVGWLPGNRIVFGWSTGGKTDFWTMNPDGSKQQLTFAGDIRAIEPALSPDGRYLAYVAKNGLWRMELEGSRLKQLVISPFVMSAVFSPDGKWIFYDSVAAGAMGIWKISVDGGEPVKFGEMGAFVFSADGKYLAYPSGIDPATATIEIVSVDSGQVVQTLRLPHLTGGRSVEWLGEASIILSVRGGRAPGIYRVPRNGGPESPVALVSDGNLRAASVSPDGKYAAYIAGGDVASVVTLQNFR